MNLPYRHDPKEFNPNALWHVLSRDHQHDTSKTKGNVIRNPCIRVGKRLLVVYLWGRIVWMCLTYLVCHWLIDCVVQSLVLHKGLWLEALLPPIARTVGIELNLDDRVPCCMSLNIVEQIKFYKVEVGRISWIYPGSCLMPLPNVELTALFNRASLYYLPSDEGLGNRHHLFPCLTLGSLVHPNRPPPLIMLVCKLPLSPFKRSRYPSSLCSSWTCHAPWLCPGAAWWA